MNYFRLENIIKIEIYLQSVSVTFIDKEILYEND